MSLAPRPAPRDVSADTRAAARRQGRGLASVAGVVPGILIAVVVMVVFIALDYTFDQDPHRVVKVALGVLAMSWMAVVPGFGLLVFPVVTPLLGWVPPAPIPGLNATNAMLGLILGSYAMPRILRRQPVFRRGHLSKVIGLFVLMALIATVRGAAFPTEAVINLRDVSLVWFRSAVNFSVYFIVLAMVHGQKERQRVWWALAMGLLLESALTIALGRNGRDARAIGSIGQANDLGSYLALLGVMVFAAVPARQGWFAKLITLVTFGMSMFGVVLSLSRGALLAVAGGLLVVALRSSRVMLFLLLATLATSPLWAPDYLVDRIMSSQREVEGSDETTVDGATEVRLQTWQTILRVVKDHPVDGIGFNALPYVLPQISDAMGLVDVADSAHNTYLRMLAEMGVFGLAMFVWLMWSCWSTSDRLVRRAKTRFDRMLGVGLGGATVSLAISCAFGDRFFSLPIAASFWLLCGLADAALTEQVRPA